MRNISWCFFLMGIVFPLALAHGGNKNPALIDLDLAKSAPAPSEINYDSYIEWADQSFQPEFISAFMPYVFEWYEEEKNRGLPPEVYQDKERIYANVERPLSQTIELEESGEIEEGNTVGAEVYAEMKGSPQEALNAMLYRWGKPVKSWDGKTYPPGGPYAKRVEYFAPIPKWGENAYVNLSLRRDGGIIKDLADRYVVLIRGDESSGYDVFMQYFQPGGATPTQQVFAIAMIRPLTNGNVSYKINTRYQGQSYKVLGNVAIGRAQIGFNLEKVRSVQSEYMNMLRELKATGNIRDTPTDIEFGR